MSELVHRSPGQESWARLRGNRAAMVSLWLLALIILACVIGPWLSPYGYNEQDPLLGAQPPSAEHWMGTDLVGRDLFTHTLEGGRVSLLVGFLATLVACVIGVLYGMVAGWFGGRVDHVMMRLVDIIYGLPFTLMVILLMVAFNDQGIYLIFAAIGLVEWLTMARIVRGQTLILREAQFVQASACLGQTTFGIFRSHLLPNLLAIVVVYATLTVPSVMLLESFLSYLGLGVQAPDTSWGELIKQGADAMEDHWWRLLFPSLFFGITLLCLNFLGDGLRDAFDPRAQKR